MKNLICLQAILCLALSCLLTGCNRKVDADGESTAPPPVQIEKEDDSGVFKVDQPEKFSLVAAGEHKAEPELNVTGVVSPDISRNIPVISMATGRVVEIAARIGDTVKKGQIMMKVQSPDIAQAFSDYRQAVADATLAKAQLERSQALYERGAIAQKDLEVAVDTEAKARVMLETTIKRLKVLGVTDLDHPDPIVNIYAPASGVVTDQQVTAASGTQGLASPNAFTISDLSHVWIICDVYENNLPFVHIGDYADVRLNAYPAQVFKGRISNIGPILDPNLRTAKVRLEMQNPGMMRIGMFVSATFHRKGEEVRATVPPTAILRLHDRDWVYIPKEGGRFERKEVTGLGMIAGNLQEVTGIEPGQQVVENALILQTTVEQ